MEYHRTQVALDGYLFDSETECRYYKHLLELGERDLIADIEVKPSFVLIPPFEWCGHKENGMVYTPDFSYIELKTNTRVYIEVKGVLTDEFRLRLKIWKWLHPLCPLKIVCWSKSTGFMEMSDYKVARKRIVREEFAQRVIRKREELKAKYERLKAVAHTEKQLARLRKYEEELYGAVELIPSDAR